MQDEEPSTSSLVMVRTARRMTAFAWILLSVDFLDELAAGIPGAGASGIQAAFAVSHTAMGGLITAFGLLALFVEPPLFFLADRYPRRWFVCGGLFGLGISCLVAALSPSYWWLFLSLLLFGPLSGCGVSLSQATLIDTDPENAERALTRWTLAGSLGDLATPGLLAVAVALGWGWRGAFAFCGIYACVQAALLWPKTFPDEAGRQEPEEQLRHLPWRQAIALALRNRSLLLWSLALVSCSLLDETLVAFSTLRMTRELALSDGQALLVIACLSAGAVLSLMCAELLHGRLPPQRLLESACVVSLVAHIGFSFSRSLELLMPFAMLSGFSLALHYPLAKARLYRAIPGRTGTAVAVAGLFGPVDLAVPVLIGLVADRLGLTLAVLLLGLQPIVLFAASRASSRDEAANRPSGAPS